MLILSFLKKFVQLQICVVNIMEAATSRLIAHSLRSMWNAPVNPATLEMAMPAPPSTAVLRKLMVAAVTSQTAFSLDLWVNMILFLFFYMTEFDSIHWRIYFCQNERRCECLEGYVGNGVQCFEKVVPPVDRCLENNGDCDANAICKDLHFHSKYFIQHFITRFLFGMAHFWFKPLLLCRWVKIRQ